MQGCSSQAVLQGQQELVPVARPCPCPSSWGQDLGTSPTKQPAVTLLTQHLGAEELQPNLRQNQT